MNIELENKMSKERELLKKVELLFEDINRLPLLCDEIAELLAQPEPVVTGMSKEETPPYDMSIHSNPSAMAWTKFFRECRPECNLDDETMLGWFANAMMAMHDHIYQTSPPNREPLSDDEILTGIKQIETPFFNYKTFILGIKWAEKQHNIGE